MSRTPMQLLVSVADAIEAQSAHDGGADIIDAKDPAHGALGPVSLVELRHICEAVAGRRMVTAALGDADDERAIARTAAQYAACGVGLVKIGFLGIPERARVTRLLRAARDGTQAHGRCGVVAVAYADARASIRPTALVDAAVQGGAIGVLLDTTDKDGPGLQQLTTTDTLRAWVDNAHDAGLLVAVAGRLSMADVPFVRDTGADVVGVRGAACEGGRSGRIAAEKIRTLRTAIGSRR